MLFYNPKYQRGPSGRRINSRSFDCCAIVTSAAIAESSLEATMITWLARL